MTESTKPADVIAWALDPRTPAREIQARLIVGALRDAGLSIVPTEATRSVVSAVRHHTVKHRSALRADVIRHTDPGAPDCLRCVVEAALDSDQNEEG